MSKGLLKNQENTQELKDMIYKNNDFFIFMSQLHYDHKSLIDYYYFIIKWTQEELTLLQFEPKDEEKFYPSKVRKFIQEIMDDKLKNETYDANNTPMLAEELVRRIRSKVRDSIKMSRFKIAVQVVIGEVKGQGCKLTSKSLWDPTFDNYASYAFQNETLYGVAIVFGVYYE